MSKKKVGIMMGVVAAIAFVAVAGLYMSGKLGNAVGNSADKVYVQTVSAVMQQNSSAGNRYSGVVQPQGSWEVNKETDRTISEVLVKQGDTVSEGTPLFSYDTDDMKLQIEQQKLELEDIANEVSGYTAQIAELQAEKSTAPADQQFDYTTQIQTAQTNIKQADFKKKSKQAEIDKTQKSIDNSVVTSKINGVVKAINTAGTDTNGNATAYMTILATGDYQVKGMVDETNMSAITAGEKVLIRSRVDESLTWKGTISKIDTQNTVSNESDTSASMNTGGKTSDGTTTTTKYPFYVALASMDGLILGQHVFVEPDLGQTAAKSGVWMYGSYIVTTDGDPYVWVANKRDKLEKRKVELGDYDKDLDEYQIKSGLLEDDYIAFPMPGIYAGVKTVTTEADVDYSSPLYQDNTESMETENQGGEVINDTEMPENKPLDGNEIIKEQGAAGGPSEVTK
jgi:HlyD family secretion protein